MIQLILQGLARGVSFEGCRERGWQAEHRLRLLLAAIDQENRVQYRAHRYLAIATAGDPKDIFSSRIDLYNVLFPWDATTPEEVTKNQQQRSEQAWYDHYRVGDEDPAETRRRADAVAAAMLERARKNRQEDNSLAERMPWLAALREKELINGGTVGS